MLGGKALRSTDVVPALPDLRADTRATAAPGRTQLGADSGQAHVRRRGPQPDRARREPRHHLQPEERDPEEVPALHDDTGALRRGRDRRRRGDRGRDRDRPVAVDGQGQRGGPQLRPDHRDGAVRRVHAVPAARPAAAICRHWAGLLAAGLAGGPRRGDHAVATGIERVLQPACAVSRTSRAQARSAPEARHPSTTASVPSALTRTSGSTGDSTRSSAVTAAENPGACPMPPPSTTSSGSTTVTTALIALATRRASAATTATARSSPLAAAAKTLRAETGPRMPARRAARTTAGADPAASSVPLLRASCSSAPSPSEIGM